MREIFSIIINEAPHISLSQFEMRLLVKFKHFTDIKATLGKQNKRNLLTLFFETQKKFTERERFETCTPEYYVDVMLLD